MLKQVAITTTAVGAIAVIGEALAEIAQEFMEWSAINMGSIMEYADGFMEVLG